MRKILAIGVLLLMGALAARAQGTSDVYQVSPFVHQASTDTFEDAGLAVQIINPGEQGTPISANHGTVCADIYLFDQNQEMLECCQCRLTANALLTLAIGTDLNHNPLTGFPAPPIGVVKIVSDNAANCDATSPVPTPDLRAWLLTSSFVPIGSPTVFHAIRNWEQFAQATLKADELAFLGQACSFVQFLGSGKGTCTCPLRVG